MVRNSGLIKTAIKGYLIYGAIVMLAVCAAAQHDVNLHEQHTPAGYIQTAK